VQTKIELDDDLIAEAMRLSGVTSEKDVVDLALRELVRSRQRKDLLDLVGQIDIDPDFDHKATRRTRYDAG
jgi:Arc/MetJ family transcription regulator